MNTHYNEIISFIRNTFHETEKFIPLHEPRFTGNEKKYLLDTIDSTFVSSVGKYVDQLEIEIAKYTGATKAVACVNGTNALHLALVIAGVNQNDEVITQDLTFIATANAISYCGAHPIFVDIDKTSLGMSPTALEEWLSENTIQSEKNNEPICLNIKTGNRVSACVPMHTFGHPCDMDAINSICKKHHIAVVEDAAESMGSYYKGKHTGTSGDIGVISFNGNKIMTSGGGGMLLFNNESMAARAKHLSTQAKLPHAWEFNHDAIGYNYRMPNLNAALALAQLEQLDSFVAKKRKLARIYADLFAKKEIPFILEPTYAQSNYWLNAILLPNKEERDLFLKTSNSAGVMTRPAWELMHTLPMFAQSAHSRLSNAIEISSRLVNIPSSVI